MLLQEPPAVVVPGITCCTGVGVTMGNIRVHEDWHRGIKAQWPMGKKGSS